LLFSVLGIAVAGIPTWIYLGARWAIEPSGFWQNFALVGMGLFFLGGIQFLLAILLAYWLFWVWFET